MLVNEGAETVGPFAKRCKERVLGLRLDVVKERRREDAITAIHETFLVVVIHIDITVGFLPNIVAMCVLALGVVVKGFNGFVDDLVDEFAVVGEEVLDAVVFGGDESLRPIHIDGLVMAEQHRIKVVTINNALVIQTGIVEAVLVLVLNQ